MVEKISKEAPVVRTGRKESQEAALTRRIGQLEQRVFALEEMLLKADELRCQTADEALVAEYGESVDESLARACVGVTRSTVYAMLADVGAWKRRAAASA